MENKDESDDRTCAGCLNKELRLASVCPNRERTELFVDSQWSWGRVSVTYVLYRIIVAVLLIAWTVADFFVEAGRWYSFNYALWLVFATNWSLLFLCISCVVMAITATYFFIRERCAAREDKDLRIQPMGGGLTTQWLIYNIAANSSLVVSISYWGFVMIIDGSGFLTTSMSQLKHTLTSVYVIVDMFVNAVPIRILHLVYPMAFGSIYAIFNAVYFINDGLGPDGTHYAYYVLDWRSPIRSAITCFLGLILCILVQGMLYGIFRGRLWFHRRLTSRIDEDLERAQLGKDANDEDSAIFPSNLVGPNYNSLNDLELRTG